MRALVASVLMALALLWVSATGGRVTQTHPPVQSLSPWAPRAETATFTTSGQPAHALLTSSRQARRGPGFQPLPFRLPAPLRLALPIAELGELFTLRCAPARGARLLPHGPRAPPLAAVSFLFT